jgi:hypothetical protein
LRVDRGAEVVLLDNMGDRGVTGTTDWQPQSAVLPVDSEATKLIFGALLTGPGTLHADEFALEIVPDDTPSTVRKPPAEPQNLSFD